MEKNYNRNQTEARKLRQKAYNTTAWQKLRKSYIKLQPLCEKCLEKGTVRAAENVHHKRSPFIAGEINYSLLLDPDNLQSLCRECHAEIHNREQGYTPQEEIIRQLEDLLDERITDAQIEKLQ